MGKAEFALNPKPFLIPKTNLAAAAQAQKQSDRTPAAQRSCTRPVSLSEISKIAFLFQNYHTQNQEMICGIEDYSVTSRRGCHPRVP